VLDRLDHAIGRYGRAVYLLASASNETCGVDDGSVMTSSAQRGASGGRTDELLTEIARPGSTRESIAAIYARGIREHASKTLCDGDFVDWPTVNKAILTRYTVSGLNYIKAQGWKLAGYR
jgi:hypothetical protein